MKIFVIEIFISSLGTLVPVSYCEIATVRDKRIKSRKSTEEIILKTDLADQVLDGQIKLQDYEKILKNKLKV